MEVFGHNKRFKSNPVLGAELNPVPKDLQNILDLIGQSFNKRCDRNLNLMKPSSDVPLYGFLTHYHGGNFCWIQPTRTVSRLPEFEYDQYIKKVNLYARLCKLKPLKGISIGENCLARYEADGHWYRAMIIGMPENNKWPLIFIDYGNLQSTSLEEIRAPVLERDCDHFRPSVQAVCCRLYNVVPRHPDCRSEIDKKFEAFFSNHANDFLEIIVKDIRTDFIVDCDVFLSKKTTKGRNRLYKKHMGYEVVDLALATFADPNAAHAIYIGSESDETVITIDESDEETKPDIKTDFFKMEQKLLFNLEHTAIEQW